MWSEHAYRVLPITLYIFIALYLLFTLSHVFVIDYQTRTPLVFAATSSAVIAAAIRAAINHPLVKSNAENVLLVLVVMGALNSLLHLFITADIQQSTNLIFVIAVSGFLITNTKRFAAVTLLTLLLWVMIAAWLAGPGRVHFVYALLMGTVTGGLLHYLRRLSVKKEHALEETLGQLAQLSQNNDRLLETLSNGVLTFDAEGTVSFCNQAATELLGLSATEIRSRNVSSLFSRPPIEGQLVEATRAGHRDGVYYELLCTKVDAKDPVSGSFLILTRSA